MADTLCCTMSCGSGCTASYYRKTTDATRLTKVDVAGLSEGQAAKLSAFREGGNSYSGTVTEDGTVSLIGYDIQFGEDEFSEPAYVTMAAGFTRPA